MSEQHARETVIEAAQQMSREGLSAGRSGNVSKRYGDGFLITPSGMLYEDLAEDDIVLIGLDGAFHGSRMPSSEWQFHLDIYKDRPSAGGIVHCHSRHATALACARRPIPAFHYMVAAAGGREIPLADYATFGTKQLSKSILKALGNHRACLMANHGQIAMGRKAFAALELAREVEELAAQYCLALQAGEPFILPDDEMDLVIEKFKSYGQNALTGPAGDKNLA